MLGAMTEMTGPGHDGTPANAPDGLPVLSFLDQSALREWLATHHTSHPGIWLRIATASAPVSTVTFAEVLEEGLAHGWSEASRRRYDEVSYLQRFAPRRRIGTRSDRNLSIAQRLIAEGRMTPAGYRALGVPDPGEVRRTGAGDVRDYVAWHEAYDDPESALSKRLQAVRTEIDRYLTETAPGPVRLVSACAGDGRDVLGVLALRPDRRRVSGVLIEILDELADRAAATIADLGLAEQLTVRRCDAGVTDAYVDAVPADLVIVSGIMGNLTATDVERLIHTTRSLCAPGATVVWTRGRMEPDLGPQIRRWFRSAGFAEVRVLDAVAGSPMRVGVHRLVADPLPLRTGQPIFTFLR